MPLRTDLRLRRPLPGLLRLPWDRPLEDWQPEEAALRDMPVGPSRHLVRFVEADDRLWAVKELPERVAEREYAVLRELEVRGLPAVKAAGLVHQPESGNALLDTTSCALAQRRFRYSPARDAHGNPVAGTATRCIRWEIPVDIPPTPEPLPLPTQ